VFCEPGLERIALPVGNPPFAVLVAEYGGDQERARLGRRAVQRRGGVLECHKAGKVAARLAATNLISYAVQFENNDPSHSNVRQASGPVLVTAAPNKVTGSVRDHAAVPGLDHRRARRRAAGFVDCGAADTVLGAAPRMVLPVH
jgi:hypothetical protein